MNSALEPGCLAVVIKSQQGLSVNLVVQCVEFIQHPKYGPVWRVRSRSVLTVVEGQLIYTALAPSSWLRKIQPGELDSLKTPRQLESSNI